MIAAKKNLPHIRGKGPRLSKAMLLLKVTPSGHHPSQLGEVVFTQRQQHKYEPKATLIWSNEIKHTKMTFHSISLASTPCSQVPDHDLTALTPGLPIHTMYSQRNFPGYNIQRTEDTETDRSPLHDTTTWWKNQETVKLMWEQDGHIREEWQGPEEGHTVLKDERNQPREECSSRPLTGTCLCRAFLPEAPDNLAPLFYLEIPRFPQSGQLRHRLYVWVL